MCATAVSFFHAPGIRCSRRGDERGGAHAVGHVVADRLVALAGVDQLGDVLAQGGRGLPVGGVDPQRRLLDGQLADRQARGGCLKGQDRAGGQAPHVGSTAGCADHRSEVLDLPLDGVGRRVAAVATAAAVVAVDGEPRRQQLGQLDLAGNGGS